MKRLAVLAAALTVTGAASAADFSIVEASVTDMQKALKEGRVTSHELVAQSLARIAMYENQLNSTLAVAKDAFAQADALDRERAAGKIRGPLHGIPIAIKDNINTTDMPTTAGTLAFEGLVPPYEATLTKNLRDGGAIIVAKTVMTEMANWMVLGMPNNYSSLGGYAFNPYDTRRDPRPGMDDGRGAMITGSSSSGSGTAMSLWALNFGTETTVSIIGPSSNNMLVGIKPTLGRVSRWGIIPVSLDQDTAGPMARNVTDAAIALGVAESVTPDPNDNLSKRCAPPSGHDYTQFLKPDSLKGARIGVPRASFVDDITLSTGEKKTGVPADQKKMLEEAIAALRAAGATVVDADIPSVLAKDPAKNILSKDVCHALNGVGFKGNDSICTTTLKYSFKRDINAYLASLGAKAPFKNLTEMRAWNVAHAKMNTMKYGQGTMDMSDDADMVADKAHYDADRAWEVKLAGQEGVDAALKKNKLDAIIFLGQRGDGFVAKAGYPTITVPFGMVENGTGWPAGWTPKPIPLGITFSATACSEPRLIALAYAFEQATKRRRPPGL